MNRSAALLLCVSLAACGGAAIDSEESSGAVVDDLTSATITVKPRVATSVSFKAAGGAMSVTVDCARPADPDVQGPVFEIKSAALGLPSFGAEPARAGYWQFSGKVAAGTQQLTVLGVGPAATCKVQTAPLSGSCTAGEEWRSPETGHTHIKVGNAAGGAEEFPASGNHWGAWAKWSTVYDKPVQRGFLLHNLEHGGVVLSYGCSGPGQSAKCADAKAQLVSLARAFGQGRFIVTPDPTQPTLFGLRGWRMAHASDCLDATAAKAFLKANYRHGREDEDSDPPVPFDPTTRSVPCQDLMAAPDSCG